VTNAGQNYSATPTITILQPGTGTTLATANVTLASVTGGGLTKTGAGTLTLSAANTYTGNTTVSSGTLLINGNQSSAIGTVSVSNTATLGGSGIIGGAVSVASGGILAPGNNTIGNLTAASLTLNSGAISDFQISGTTAGTFDTITSAGSLALNGTLNLIFSATLTNGDSIDLFPGTGTLSGNFANNSVIASGSYTGTFTQNGSLWTLGTGGGNSITFEATTGILSAVPEPATWALLAFSLTTVMVLRRRRNS